MWLRAAALAAAFAGPAAAERLTIATWNLEWMMRPQVFDALAADCYGRDRRPPGEDRSIPCDLAPKGRWSEDDLARLRAFAAALPIDVIALQEVDGEDAARAIFPGHEFCFTKRRHVQNVGFAVRKGLRYRCNRDYEALGLPEDTVRWGADITVEPGTGREMRLLAVHLKASCNRDPLTTQRDDCQLLQRQVPVLEEWIDSRARAKESCGVIGDFNRRFDRERVRDLRELRTLRHSRHGVRVVRVDLHSRELLVGDPVAQLQTMDVVLREAAAAAFDEIGPDAEGGRDPMVLRSLVAGPAVPERETAHPEEPDGEAGVAE